jgi:hypothetical protein
MALVTLPLGLAGRVAARPFIERPLLHHITLIAVCIAG